MVAVVQRVSRAAVRVDGMVTGAIGPGLLVLLGVQRGDTDGDASWMAAKITGLRIFSDTDGKMNLGLEDVQGSMLVVSQFTLLGDCVKGRRPSFTGAAPPDEVNRLYERFCGEVRDLGVRVETGVFQAMMEVELVNDGPVTLWIDSTRVRPREGERVTGFGAGFTSAGATLLGLRGVPLALASRSPRRRELLERLEIPILVLPFGRAGGNRRDHESPSDYVQRLATEKGRAIEDAARAGGAYASLGADTVVEVDGAVLEQPRDRAEAVELLGRIGGRWHRVWTGLSLAVLPTGREGTTVEMTRVWFDRLAPSDLELYLATGEPMDKAGAYGVQGWGIFVPRIEGDFFNVMGLPLAGLRRLCLEVDPG